jgi:hypothetical protein
MEESQTSRLRRRPEVDAIGVIDLFCTGGSDRRHQIKKLLSIEKSEFEQDEAWRRNESTGAGAQEQRSRKMRKGPIWPIWIRTSLESM